MATSTSVSPTVERSSSRRHQSSSVPTRSHSTRTKTATVPPLSPSRTQSTHHHHRSSSRHGAIEEVLPKANYETSNVAHTSRRSSSKDRPLPPRTESSKSASHHRPSHSRYSSDMTTSTANGGGPAPVVTPQESRHSGRSGKSRTAIPAATGNWVLGKTIGAGSMGKVKLARRVEGGEQVNIDRLPRMSMVLIKISRLLLRSSPGALPMMAIIKVVQIGSVPTIRKRFEQLERPLLSLFWITPTYARCEMLCALPTTGTCFLNMSMGGKCSTISFLMED